MSPFARLLGTPVLRHDHGEHPFAPERRYQLLAFLACRGDWVGRDEAAMLLWEHHESDAARRNLRRLLHDIRAVPELDATLERRGDALRWHVDTDLAGFERAWREGDWPEAMALRGGALLQGLERNATEAWIDWLRAEREALHRKWLQCAERQRAALRDDPGARLHLEDSVLRHDQYDETAIANLAAALRALGREAEARAAQRAFEERLHVDLGVPPLERNLHSTP